MDSHEKFPVQYALGVMLWFVMILLLAYVIPRTWFATFWYFGLCLMSLPMFIRGEHS